MPDTALAAAEQHVDRAGAAIDRPRGREGEDRVGLLQNQAGGVLENRSAMTGSQAFPVDDAHAVDVRTQHLLEELAQAHLRLDDGEAVQVELGFDAILAATQFPEYAVLDAGAAEVELVAAFDQQVAGRELVLKHEEGAWVPGAFRDLETFLHGHLAATDAGTGLIAIATDRRGRDARASRLRAVWTVLLPPLIPAILTGFALAFARAVGEYGSVIFVAGNIPYVSEIVPLLIIIKLEEFNYTGATAIATIMLAISFLTLLAINLLQAYSRRRFGHA